MEALIRLTTAVCVMLSQRLNLTICQMTRLREILKAAGEGGSADYEHITYEGYGPNGTAIIVETLTDNKNRTASNVKSAFTKGNGNVGTPDVYLLCLTVRDRLL